MLLLAFLPFHIFAQSVDDSTNLVLNPLRIQQDFKINGKLIKPVWEKAQAIYISHEFTPFDHEPAPVQTIVKVLYSDKYLYIGFWAQDPDPSKIRAHISDRDQLSGEDQVGLLLNPVDISQHAVEFFVNPLGIQLDADRIRSNKNINFDMLWYSKAAVNDSGYTAVMKIPYSSLHFPNKTIQNWPVNFIRKYPRSNHYEMSWVNLRISDPCILCQNSLLTGMTGIKSHNPVNFIPYVMGFKSSTLNNPRDPASGLNNKPLDGRIGGTITYSPTSTTTIDATFNPDFSQVETDVTQISVNKTFAINYPERRPFFLKESTVFQTGTNLFYSRSINHPWAATKYTQAAHKYSIGFLTAYDRDAPFIVPGLLNSSTVESNISAYDNVLRGKLNIGTQSSIGGLLTTRNEKDGYNHVGGIDWDFYLGGHYYFSGDAAYSNTKELSDTTLFNAPRRYGNSHFDAAFNGQKYDGSFLNIKFSRVADYYKFSFGYKSLSPTFQAQNGFITKIDRRILQGSQEFDYYPNKKWLSQGGISVNGNWRYDFSDLLMERFIHVSWHNNFTGQTRLSLMYMPLNDERFRGHYFSKVNHGEIMLSSKPASFFSFNVDLEEGRFIRRTLHPQLGHGYNFSASATIKPISRLQIKLNYSYSTLSSLDNSNTFYRGSISRLEGHYSFSRHLFFRLITQYNSLTKQIQGYPLFYYKLNPFTKFYIGMTDNLQHVNRFGPPRINAYRQINREFFIKIQYLFRK